MISLGLSESPAVREKIRQQVEDLARTRNLRAEVEVLSAYKPGFFWLTEKVLPRLKNLPVQKVLIRLAEVQDLPGEKIKRFYSDPNRWLQELYPVDEILAAELKLSVESIQFEKTRRRGHLRSPGFRPPRTIFSGKANSRRPIRETFPSTFKA